MAPLYEAQGWVEKDAHIQVFCQTCGCQEEPLVLGDYPGTRGSSRKNAENIANFHFEQHPDHVIVIAVIGLLN